MNTPNRRGASFDCLSLLVLAAPLLAVVLQRAIANPLQGSQNRSAAANGSRSSPLAGSGSGTIHAREKRKAPGPHRPSPAAPPAPKSDAWSSPGACCKRLCWSKDSEWTNSAYKPHKSTDALNRSTNGPPEERGGGRGRARGNVLRPSSYNQIGLQHMS